MTTQTKTEAQGFFPSLWRAGHRDPIMCDRLSIDIRPLTPEQTEAVTAMLTEGVKPTLREELFFSPGTRTPVERDGCTGEPGLAFTIDFQSDLSEVPSHSDMRAVVEAITALAPDARVGAEIASVPTWVWHDDDEQDEHDLHDDGLGQRQILSAGVTDDDIVVFHCSNPVGQETPPIVMYRPGADGRVVKTTIGGN